MLMLNTRRGLIVTKNSVAQALVDIKPLSVNKCWRGRRFKTQDYKEYEKKLLDILPSDLIVPEEGKLVIHLIFGFSSMASDWDNPIKAFQDILQKKYSFNDSRIFEAHVYKKIVKKGDDFVFFRLSNTVDEEERIERLLKT